MIKYYPLQLTTGEGVALHDVTPRVRSCLDDSGIQDGFVTVTSRHTTTALTINEHEERLLDTYFSALSEALVSRGRAVDPTAIEQEWRALYPLAWTDFHRFMKGWSPGHWKIHGYSERLARQVLAQLNREASH